MSVYRPTYRDPKTGKQVKAKVWWVEFTIAGRRVRESAKTTRKTLAVEYEKQRRLEMERAYAGQPAEGPAMRIRTLKDVLDAYRDTYPLNHRASSVANMRWALSNIERHMGADLLPDLTEDRIKRYIAARLQEGVGGRTVNYELGEMSRALGRPWRALWRIRKLEERHEVGKALTAEEERRLVEAADRSPSPNLRALIRTALLTGARAGEITSLRWSQVDLTNREITVGTAKTKAGTGRVIPMSEDLYHVMSAHAAWFTAVFGETKPEHYVFPFGSPLPKDPTRPTVEIKTAWASVRKAAGVNCRWHDLRHTAATKLAEAGVGEGTFKALFGWTSPKPKLIERYSHVRMEAKREAVKAMKLAAATPDSPRVPKESPKDGKTSLVQ